MSTISEKEVLPATFQADTKFFKIGDKFNVEIEDGAIKYGKNPYGRRYARFGMAKLEGQIAKRFESEEIDKLFVIGFTADDLERPDIRVIIYYKKENMARRDWEDIKAAIQSESPVVWEILRKRTKNKSVDVIE